MMKEETRNTIERIYNVVFPILTALLGVAFIVQVWRLYLGGGESPYTPQAVKTSLLQIVWLAVLWVACFLFGVCVCRQVTEKITAPKNVRLIYTRLCKRLPKDLYTDDMKQKENTRKILLISSVGISILFVIGSIILLLCKGYVSCFGGSFFSAHTEAEKAVWIVVAFVVVFAYCLWSKIKIEQSYEQEIALIKDVFKNNKQALIKSDAKEDISQPANTQTIGLLACRIGVAVFGITMLVIGICNGGMADVLEKAINICTQCIGLG